MKKTVVRLSRSTQIECWKPRKGDWLKNVEPAESRPDCSGRWFRVVKTPADKASIPETGRCWELMPENGEKTEYQGFIPVSCWEPDAEGEPAPGPRA